MAKKFSTNKYLWFLSGSAGILLWLGWPAMPLAFLLFIGFVPIFLIEETIAGQGAKASTLILFEHVYVAFLLWNALATWWIVFASPAGAAMAILANAFLMTLPVLLFHKTKMKLGRLVGYISFVAYWLTFEYVHHQWELTWPWLTLGNGLAMFPQYIQFYEYTGVFGGSLWILLVNLLIFFEVKKFIGQKTDLKHIFQKINYLALSRALLGVLVPALLSYVLYIKYTPVGTAREVVIVQPNIDPYNEKFNGLSPSAQLKRLFDMSLGKVTPTTDYLIWPETALQFTMWVDSLKQHAATKAMMKFVEEYPRTTLVTGLFAYKNYVNGNGVTPTARKFGNGRCCYDAYNSALLVDTTASLPIYHKSKLVPGVERMPYPGVFGLLNKLAIDLGGIAGSLATQDEREVFFFQDGTSAAPVICYESVFGEYVSEYIRNGAQAIFIITNDGWWGDTPGHRQHLHYASLRAIETRRYIARSANTGISCIIDQRGRILGATKYNTQVAFRGKIAMSKALTFYTRYGDLIGKAAALATLFLMLVLVVSFVEGRRARSREENAN